MYELLAGEKPFAIVWDLFGDGDVDEYGEMKDMDLRGREVMNLAMQRVVMQFLKMQLTANMVQTRLAMGMMPKSVGGQTQMAEMKDGARGTLMGMLSGDLGATGMKRTGASAIATGPMPTASMPSILKKLKTAPTTMP